MRFRWTSIFVAVAALGTVVITAPPALAQWGRAINVNGQWLNPYQIAQVDQIACVWGVVGNPLPMGRAPCGGNGGGGGGGSHWNRAAPTVVAPGNCEGGSCVNISPDLK